MRKRWLALILALCLMAAVWVPSAYAVEDVSFVAVNDTIPLTLPAGSGPYQAAAGLYVPYTVFDASPGGIVSAYNAKEQTLVLLTREKILLFDLDKGKLTDEAGNVSDVMTTYKNGILYVPAAICAAHFGLKVSVLTSRDGYKVLRFTNGGEVYDNNTFMDRAENLISSRIESLTNPPANNAQTGAPNGGGDKTEQTDPVSVYIAVTGAETMEQAAQAFEARSLRAAFFLTGAEIAENPALVRRLYAAGHSIGLTLAEDEASPIDALHEANDALDAVLHMKTLLVLLKPVQAEGLSGFCVFHADEKQPSVETILAYPNNTRLLTCASDAPQLLERLRGANIAVRLLRETTRLG
ncbi:MAG: hypothetical protein IIV87_04455 [Oscillospiraceae bacterium]|nr:hypothetical protein [Oscillospiraceae bacterium]